MNYQVFVTSRAKQQLAESAKWWAENRCAEQAARWLDGFEKAIAELSIDPQEYPLARESLLYELPHPVRQLHYGSGKRATHRAVFEIRDESVFVVAIRHLAQDDLSPDEI